MCMCVSVTDIDFCVYTCSKECMVEIITGFLPEVKLKVFLSCEKFSCYESCQFCNEKLLTETNMNAIVLPSVCTVWVLIDSFKS